MPASLIIALDAMGGDFGPEVVVPGAEGDFGVLPRHSPLISTLRPGALPSGSAPRRPAQELPSVAAFVS